MWNQGIHARSGVTCTDCHMPYKRVGALKISDHHVRSPLLNINRACQTCHKWSEEELRERVLDDPGAHVRGAQPRDGRARRAHRRPQGGEGGGQDRRAAGAGARSAAQGAVPARLHRGRKLHGVPRAAGSAARAGPRSTTPDGASWPFGSADALAFRGHFDVHGDSRPDPSQHRHRFVAPAAMVRRQHVGRADRHLHDGRPLPREDPGRPGRRHQRRGAGRARHPHARRLPLRRGSGRPLVAPLPDPALGGVCRRRAATGRDARAVAALSARHAAQRDLHGLAVAPCGRQNRTPAAWLSQAVAHGPGQDPQARTLWHVLLAGHGAVPRHPHGQIQGQAPGDLGHGRSHEHGAARAARRRLPADPDRGADIPLHGEHLRENHEEVLFLIDAFNREVRASTTASCGSTRAGATRTCSA